jgi:hypothetical protein
MITRFDHAIVAVRDLAAGVAAWRGRGFDVVEGGRHPGRGTDNAIVRFGLDYLELLSLYSREEALAAGGNGAVTARFLDEHEGGLLGYALATDDIDGLAGRLAEVGVNAKGPIPRSRVRPDGRTLKWRLLFPFGTTWGTPWPMFIQWDDPDAERLAVERPGRHANGVTRVAAVRVEAPELAPVADVYRRMGVGAEVGGTRIELAERPGAAGGVAEIVLAGTPPAPAATLLGSRYRVEAG